MNNLFLLYEWKRGTSVHDLQRLKNAPVYVNELSDNCESSLYVWVYS